jgi:S-DNA-T family DNA segregation ATPase FtsK/SpoIIIE
MKTQSKGDRFPIEMELMKGVIQSLKLATDNNEFALFWLVGVLLHVIAFQTFNTWAWIAIGLFDWVIGSIGVRSTVRPVEKALTHCGVSFSSAYGTPKWILAEKYPCSTDTIEFTACGHPAESYQAHVSRISAGLNLPIQKITEDRPGAQVLQAHIVRTQIPSRVDFSEIDLARIEQGQFVYGKTNQGFKFDNLKDAIHMIVAGQIGSGKTYFIQQLAITILMRSREAHAAIIDMKGGVDFPDFRSLQNCELVTTRKEAHTLLDALVKIHEDRAKYLVDKGKRNWRDLSLKELKSEKRFEQVPIGPILLITDELAELTGYNKDSETKQSIHQRLSLLGRLARATGIHVIAGTQRPDSTIIDSQTKDSLITKVCLSVPSVAASTLVVGNMSAYTIGRHPGRAIVATGMDRVMVQTPFLSPSELKKLTEQLYERLKQDNYSRKVVSEATAPISKEPQKKVLTDESKTS